MNEPKSIKTYLLFAEAWGMLAVARLMLVFLPFKKIIPYANNHEPAASLTQGNTQILQAIGLAVTRAARYSPWRTKCFEQALAAKIMLKRRGFTITIYFGVHKQQGVKHIAAHAWLESNGIIVTGGKTAARFKIIGIYKS